MLPHVWNFSKTIRFFADDIDEMREISSYLEQELRNRQSYENNDASYKMFMPYYLIITDDYKRVENLKIINEIQKNKTNLGFSLLSITSDLSQLPNECKTFVSLEKDKKGIIFDNEISENNQREIAIDIDFEIFFEKLIPIISNIPIRYSANGSTLLPNTYTFLEMYDVGLIEQLNILERWKRNDTTISLKAPIGIDSSGMPIILDIHEKVHGPHGLIAGSTGSGKSEFIITYILSLAINYAPDDVSFLLIDYKGGGLAGAFQKGDTKLPHIVGTITNIDTNGLQRSLASIQSELRRRQIMFNEARNLVDEGTIDIYKYQKLYHEGIVKKPIPHLLIICDEFAELKQQQEEFMDELISVSRIGRSLGVHLILATQKPAGIVNDQIRSNSKFAICLKVQDVEDSNDVIKKPDAANLKGSGQFYMQVGNDDYFVLGQSAWAGAPYYPSNTTKKTVDTSIQFVSNVGIPIKDVDNIGSKRVVSYGEQLTNIVRYIIELAKKENIKTNNLWLEDIPENIYLDKLKKKYPVSAKGKEINVIIGEYDDPYNQKQGLVNINYTKSGNVIIYGNAESGKETLLSTIVYDLITTYSSKEVQIYILDFGSEVLKIFKNSPHVGDVTFISEFEKISRFFEMIQREIKERKNILSNYNGDYELYVNTKGNTMPMLVVILNNYEAFDEMYGDKFDDLFLTITREGIKCGIVFTVTTSAYNNMRYRLTQNFRKKIALQLNNEDDYYNIFEKAGKKKPSSIFGRGLVTINDDTVYEFQTAKICQAVDYNSTINETIEILKKQNNPEASEIPTIPDRILVEDIKDYIKDISKVPIGITKKELKIFNYDFKKNFVCTMTSKNIEDVIEFVNYLIKEISMIDGIEIVLFDAENTIKAKKESLSDEIDRFMAKMNNKKINATISHTIVIINGLDKFISDVQEEYFYEMINNAKEKEKYSFIIIEKTNKFKNHEYDEWYKKYVENDSGIYIGNGIEDQYFIEISDRQNLENNCGRSYGYVVIQGIPTLIKLVGMKEAGEENE